MTKTEDKNSSMPFIEQLKKDFENSQALKERYFFQEILNHGQSFLPSNYPKRSGSLMLKELSSHFRKKFLKDQIKDLSHSYDSYKNYLNNERNKTYLLFIEYASKYVLSSESVISSIRKIADDEISIIYLSDFHKENGQFPDQIKIDCIGSLFKAEYSSFLKKYFAFQTEYLKKINNFSNSSKHSFVQNCFDFVSHNLNKDKPSICCRSFKYNNFKQKEEIEVWDIEDMLKAHDSFCKCTEEIKQRSDFKI